MNALKPWAQTVHAMLRACPQAGDCLACRFVEDRLFAGIDSADRPAVWQWTSHAYGEMRQCELDCPATPGMARMVVHMYETLPPS